MMTRIMTIAHYQVQQLEIAEGLKQLLIDSGLTIESTIRLGSEELSKILHIDLYVGKLIVAAAKNIVRENYIQIKE
jgi:hypothetical protein